MIKSMTGYGAAKGQLEKLEIGIELKSVNNRYMDCSVRIPRIYMFAEEIMKARVQGTVSRGKVDVFVTVDSSGADDVIISVNEPLAGAYMNALLELSRNFEIPLEVDALALSQKTDVLKVEKKEADTDQFSRDLLIILDVALAGFDTMRAIEGEKMQQDIENRLRHIAELTEALEERSPRTVKEYRERLEVRMAEILAESQIDDGRILQEAAIFADRVAINEETTRLRSHVDQIRALLESGGPIGRKLDFIVQELNREANTIGSKCNDTEMSALVIDLKAEIEKIREQAQNIE